MTNSEALLGDDALRRGVTGHLRLFDDLPAPFSPRWPRSIGQPFAYTLTGFKWIGHVPGLAFGYEEAIGYCVDPAVVPDKDGISALIRILTLAARLKSEGQTLRADRLDDIRPLHYGVFETDQLSVRVADLSN